VAHVASAELERPGQRLALLVALAERRLTDRFLSRSGRFYAWGIGLSYALAMGIELGEPTWLLRRALGTLAWVSGGMVMLSALRNPDDAGERGLLALVRQRGASAGELATAQLLALARRLLRVMAWPALLLAVVAGLVTRDGFPPLVMLLSTLAVLVFVALTSVALVLAARAALILGPGRVKLTFAALMLLPHLAHAIWPSVPSIPAVLEVLLDVVTGWSGA
jgi:hypothetical protein